MVHVVIHLRSSQSSSPISTLVSSKFGTGLICSSSDRSLTVTQIAQQIQQTHPRPAVLVSDGNLCRSAADSVVYIYTLFAIYSHNYCVFPGMLGRNWQGRCSCDLFQ